MAVSSTVTALHQKRQVSVAATRVLLLLARRRLPEDTPFSVVTDCCKLEVDPLVVSCELLG
jgi:hypothetical protein